MWHFPYRYLDNSVLGAGRVVYLTWNCFSRQLAPPFVLIRSDGRGSSVFVNFITQKISFRMTMLPALAPCGNLWRTHVSPPSEVQARSLAAESVSLFSIRTNPCRSSSKVKFDWRSFVAGKTFMR